MIETWTDERLDILASKVDNLVDGIDRLVQALHLEVPALKAELNGALEEAKETRHVLDERMDRIAVTVERQASIAETQAESIRQLIEMLNRRQA